MARTHDGTQSTPRSGSVQRVAMVGPSPNASSDGIPGVGVSNQLHAASGKYVSIGGNPSGAGSPSSHSTQMVPMQQRAPSAQQLTPEQIADIHRRMEELEEAEDLQHYAKQISLIFRPVLLCIILVVWWVKVESQLILSASSTGLIFAQTVSTGGAISDGLINALIIIGVVIVITIVFVILFVKGYIKFLYGYLIVATSLLLGGTGGLFIWLQCDTLGIPLDLITLVFVAWNFAAVGIVSIFWHSPLSVRQMYLVMVSALLAYSLTKIQEWTTWFLLALLVIWDLVAVLTPCGPLRMLVNASQEQNQEIPALLYSVTMVFFMADAPAPKKKKAKKNKQIARLTDEDGESGSSVALTVTSRDEVEPTASSSSASTRPEEHQVRVKSAPAPVEVVTSPRPPAVAAVTSSSSASLPRSPATASPSISAPPAAAATASEDEEEEARRGLKLGLGDFVFYSVLVARAALSDWTTVVACICAVVTGLMSTILLLAMFKRALPALPISLAVGIMFYFVTSIVITPYVVNNVAHVVHV